MSVQEDVQTPAGATALAQEHAHENRDAMYVKIALILAAITGLETFTYFESVFDFGKALVPVLLVCMVVKFYLIAAYFMHLKWDRPILRRVFMTGILIALAVYLAALTAFKFFASGMPH